MTDVQALARQFQDDYARVREQIERVIVGNRGVIDGVLTCLFVGGHALLEGPPGIGKTLLIRTLSRALSLDFGRIQFTPDLMPADIAGTTVVHEVEGVGGRTAREFRFQPGPVFAQIILADEINRATPKTQSALLEAMQERSVTVAGTTHGLPEPFFVMATQNPIEQEGTYPLPEAQVDRFFFKLLVDYSDRGELAEILDRTTAGEVVVPEAILDGPRIIEHQRLIRRVAIAPQIQDYAIRMVLATHPKGAAGSVSGGVAPSGGVALASSRSPRPDRLEAGATQSFSTPMVNKYVRYGASPRAAQALVLGAKCRALLDGRPAASTDDIRAIALAALRHRIIVNFEAEAEGVTTDAIVRNVVETLPVEAG